jgi:hypothetical protein
VNGFVVAIPVLDLVSVVERVRVTETVGLNVNGRVVAIPVFDRVRVVEGV